MTVSTRASNARSVNVTTKFRTKFDSQHFEQQTRQRVIKHGSRARLVGKFRFVNVAANFRAKFDSQHFEQPQMILFCSAQKSIRSMSILLVDRKIFGVYN